MKLAELLNVDTTKENWFKVLSKKGINPKTVSAVSKGGGGEGEVSGEHPVKIIELTQELMTGKELDITVEQYFKYKFIFKLPDATKILFLEKEQNYEYDGNTYDIYIVKNRGWINLNLWLFVKYNINNTNSKISIELKYTNVHSDVGFVLDKSTWDFNTMVLSSIPNIPTNINAILSLTNESKIQGTYYNGTFTAFADGKILVYDINSETGEVSEKLSIDIETLAGLEARIAALEAAQNN